MKKTLGWLIVAVVTWVALSVWLFFVSPDMESLVREKGQSSIPDHYTSQVARDILTQNGDMKTESVLVVYHNENGLNDQHLVDIETTLTNLQVNPIDDRMLDMLTPFDSEALEGRLISDDGSTLMVVIEFNMQWDELSMIRNDLSSAIVVDNVSSQLTGGGIIEDDVILSTEEGLSRTEIVTVVFLLVILLLVFRSLAAPLVPLITVGAAYIMSVSIVAFLVDLFNFPISNFTQIFIVAVLFGIGTDYCILLLNRFKEELIKNSDRFVAMTQTFRAVGPTVIYSALTGFIGFAAIGLADFSLYRSAVGVSVGIVILVIALWIWVPAFMLLFGEKLFWPIRGQLKNEPNRLWGRMGSFSVKRPFLTIVLLAVLLVPAYLAYDQATSFDSLDEIDDHFESVQAFELIADKFGEGETMPVNVIVEHHQRWDNQDMMPYIEWISMELAKIDGVQEVRSATRPDGQLIEELTIPYIAKQMSEGLQEAIEGLEEVRDASLEIADDLNNNEQDTQEAQDGVQDLINGTTDLQDGIGQIRQQLGNLSEGSTQSAETLNHLTENSSNIKQGLHQLITSPALPESISQEIRQLVQGQEEINQGIQQVSQGLTDMSDGQQQLADEMQGMESGTSELIEGQEEIGDAFAEIGDAFLELEDGLREMADGMDEIIEGLTEIVDLLDEIVAQSQHPLAGFFVPTAFFEEEDTQSIWENYTTPNGQATTFQVILDRNPYSHAAMDIVQVIEERMHIALEGTILEENRFAIYGLASTNRDLETISNEDFWRTVTIMLAGIFLVLILLLRSLIMPIYILISLALTYLISVSFTELLFTTILGYPGISWAVPFFGFIMLMALGVDYSIFLMGRFNENHHLPVRQALIESMRSIGTVVLSAAIILGGTFGAMLPSGVLSLLQIGTLVLTGLLLYAFVMLPLFVPAMVSIFGNQNWWPLNRPGAETSSIEEPQDTHNKING